MGKWGPHYWKIHCRMALIMGVVSLFLFGNDVFVYLQVTKQPVAYRLPPLFFIFVITFFYYCKRQFKKKKIKGINQIRIWRIINSEYNKIFPLSFQGERKRKQSQRSQSLFLKVWYLWMMMEQLELGTCKTTKIERSMNVRLVQLINLILPFFFSGLTPIL